MKKYKQKEVAKLEGVAVRQVMRWGVEDLAAKGWTKVGEGNGCYYTREQHEESEGTEMTRADLEIRKLKAEIAEKEQKLERKRRLLYQEWSDAYTECFMDAFAPMKDLLAEARFDEENANKWNEALDKCIATLQTKSETIYLQEDMKIQ